MTGSKPTAPRAAREQRREPIREESLAVQLTAAFARDPLEVFGRLATALASHTECADRVAGHLEQIPRLRRMSKAGERLRLLLAAHVRGRPAPVDVRLDTLLDELATAAALYGGAAVLRVQLKGEDRFANADRIERFARERFEERCTLLRAAPLSEHGHAALHELLDARSRHPRGGHGRSWVTPFRTLWHELFGHPLAASDEALRNRESRRRRVGQSG